jgi:hypothetical protein
VVFCHGFTGTKELYLTALAQTFARTGILARAAHHAVYEPAIRDRLPVAVLPGLGRHLGQA